MWPHLYGSGNKDSHTLLSYYVVGWLFSSVIVKTDDDNFTPSLASQRDREDVVARGTQDREAGAATSITELEERVEEGCCKRRAATRFITYSLSLLLHHHMLDWGQA